MIEKSTKTAKNAPKKAEKETKKAEKTSKTATASTKAVKKERKPIMKLSDAPSVEELVKKIKKALVAQQTYSKSLDFAIVQAAGNYHVYLKTLTSINRRGKIQYSLITREGSTAYKNYPDIEILPTLSRALKDSLRSLGLTLDTLEAVDNDPLDKLADNVGKLLNG